MTMTDVELAEAMGEVIKIYEPLVKGAARRQWLAYGRPPGIQPRQLYNDGYAALLEIIDHRHEDLFLQMAFGRVRDRIRDGFRRLQTGAVTTERVECPDGTRRRHVYAESVDWGVENWDAQNWAAARGKPKEVLRVIRREAHGDFSDTLVAMMDRGAAIRAIPDHMDQCMIEILVGLSEREFPTVSPEEEKRIRSLLDQAPERAKRDAYSLTLWLFSWMISPREGDARLRRTASWVVDTCRTGLPGKPYPTALYPAKKMDS